MEKEINANMNQKKYFSRDFPNLVYFNWILLVLWVCFLGVQIESRILPFRFSPSDFFMFLFWVINLLNRKVTFKSFITVDLLLILMIFTISTSIALFKAQSFLVYTVINKYIGFLILVFSFFFIANVIRDSKLFLQKILRIFVLTGGILNAIYIMLSFVFPVNVNLKKTLLYSYWPSRLRGLLIDPNAYGGFLTIVFFLCLPLLINEKVKSKKILYSIILFSSLFGVVLTFSRSALLGFFVGSIIMIIFTYAELKKYIYFLITSSILSLFFLYVSNPVLYRTMLDFMKRSNTVTSRFNFIISGLELFSRNPIIGIGSGIYFALNGAIIHNTYIWILVEMGVIGLLCFVFFIFHVLQTNIQLIRKFKKSHKDLFYITVGLFCAIISMCTYGIGIEFLYQRYLWMLFALLQALLVIYKKEVIVSDQ